MATRNHINYYGILFSGLRQWQVDFLGGVLKTDVEPFAEDPVMGYKVKTYQSAETDWLAVRDPESTVPVTEAENDSIADIRSFFKVCQTMIGEKEKQKRKKEPAVADKIKAVGLAVKPFSAISLKATSKPLTEDLTERFLTVIDAQDEDMIKLIDIKAEVADIKDSLAVYKSERDKRDKIIEETNGQKPVKCPILKDAIEAMVKGFDMMNDPREGADGKTIYPYNTVINKISRRFLQLKNRGNKGGDSSTKDSK